MAVTRKGWRPINMEGESFYWRALGRDYGIDVVVVTGQAFEKGRSQQLLFALRYGGLPQTTAISPSVVRRAIELGRAQRPSFTGSKDGADVVLSAEAEEELQRLGLTAG